jgi:hypothetical protein
VWNFRRGNLYLAVDLHGVAVDYLAAEPQCERDAEFALAGRGRPYDRDDRPFGLCRGAHEVKKARKAAKSQMIVSSASAPASCVLEKRI